MPMSINDIDKFEKQNPDYIVNVYGCDESGENIYPRRISKIRVQKPINLLLLQNDEKYHYTLIKKFNSLLGNGHAHQKEFCPYCCHGFDTRYIKPGQMEEHMETCFTYGGVSVIMPKKGENKIEFTQMVAPYAIYADFEALRNKKSEEKQIHELCGYSLVVVSPYEKPWFYSHRGDNAGNRFIKKNSRTKC